MPIYKPGTCQWFQTVENIHQLLVTEHFNMYKVGVIILLLAAACTAIPLQENGKYYY